MYDAAFKSINLIV